MNQTIREYFGADKETGRLPKTAQLPGLGAEVELREDILFKDAGEVPSLVDQLKATERVIRVSNLEDLDAIQQGGRAGIMDTLFGQAFSQFMKKIQLHGIGSDIENRGRYQDFSYLMGYCYGHQLEDQDSRSGNGKKRKYDGPIGYVIAKLQGLDESKSTFVDGHSSAGILKALNRPDVLASLLEEYGIDLDLSTIPKEEIPDAAGLLALRKANDTKSKDESRLVLPTFSKRPPISPKLAERFEM